MIWASLYVLPKLSGKLSLSIFAAKKSFNFLKKLKYCKLPLIRPGLRGFNRAYKRRGLYRREQQLMAGTGKALRNIVQFTGKWAFNFQGGGGVRPISASLQYALNSPLTMQGITICCVIGSLCLVYFALVTSRKLLSYFALFRVCIFDLSVVSCCAFQK